METSLKTGPICLQTGLKTPGTKALLISEQWRTMAGKVCKSEYALDVRDDGRGNCLIAALSVADSSPPPLHSFVGTHNLSNHG